MTTQMIRKYTFLKSLVKYLDNKIKILAKKGLHGLTEKYNNKIKEHIFGNSLFAYSTNICIIVY
jgi:hypothetical protein